MFAVRPRERLDLLSPGCAQIASPGQSSTQHEQSRSHQFLWTRKDEQGLRTRWKPLDASHCLVSVVGPLPHLLPAVLTVAVAARWGVLGGTQIAFSLLVVLACPSCPSPLAFTPSRPHRNHCRSNPFPPQRPFARATMKLILALSAAVAAVAQAQSGPVSGL